MGATDRSVTLLAPAGVAAAAVVGAVVATAPVAAVGAVGGFAAIAGATWVVSARGMAALYAAVIVICCGGTIDGLPGPMLNGMQHAFPFLLAGFLVVISWPRWTQVPETLWMLSAAVMAISLFGISRAIYAGAPIVEAAMFGRDFVLFAVLLPTATAAMLDRRLRQYTLFGAAILAVWVSFANIGASLGILPPSGVFAHAYRVTPTGGVERIWTFAREITTAAFPFALGAATLGRTRRMRRGGALLLILLALEVVLALGRVKWAGLLISSLAVLVLWGQWRVIVRAGRLAAIVLVLAVAASQVGPTAELVAGLGERVGTIFASSQERADYEGHDTLKYRDTYKARIRDTMTTKEWAIGYGFLPTPWFLFEPDPIKSLRNTDLGYYNAITTVGISGLVICFLPVLFIARRVWRAKRFAVEDEWVIFGTVAFLIYIAVVIRTLLPLFTPWSFPITALLLAVGLSTALRPR